MDVNFPWAFGSFMKTITSIISIIFVFPIFTLASTEGGIAPLNASCGAPNTHAYSKAQAAISDASSLVKAALVAAKSPNQPPFSWFFNPSDANLVNTVLTKVQASLDEKQGPPIDIWCTDWGLSCGKTVGDLTLVWAYTIEDKPTAGRAAITFCQDGLTWSQAPEPCTSQPAVTGIGTLLLHELLHVTRLVGINTKDWARGPKDCASLKATRGILTRTNADSYAQLGSWARNLGLGGAPYTGKPCLEQAPPSLPVKDTWVEDNLEELLYTYGPEALVAIAAGDQSGLLFGIPSKHTELRA